MCLSVSCSLSLLGYEEHRCSKPSSKVRISESNLIFITNHTYHDMCVCLCVCVDSGGFQKITEDLSE